MAETKKLIPKRRFKEFQNAEAWEQCKLGEHATFRRGSFPQPYGNKEWYDGEGAMPFIQVIDVTKQLNLVDNTKQKISIKAQPSSVFIPKGKVIVTLQGSIGRVAITQYDAYMDRTLLLFESYKHKTDQRFWAYIIQQKFEIEKQRAPGGTIKTITKEALAKFEISLPNYDEQEKIGSFFKSIDNLITLHKRKLDKIKSTKKAYLYEMFPAEGESKPKRRFKGFTDDWEQRKLGAIVDKTYGGGTPRTSVDEFWNGDIPWFQSSDLTDGKVFGVIPNKMISASGLKNSATKLVPKNSIAIITRVGVGKLSLMPFAYATSQDFLSLSKLNIDPWFGVYSCYKKLQSELHAVQGTSIKGITKNELLEKEISVPCFDEQQQIGQFFQNLDKLITLHQHKLDKLKNLKKSYLNEMFI